VSYTLFSCFLTEYKQLLLKADWEESPPRHLYPSSEYWKECRLFLPFTCVSQCL